jgi:hypothetical protein
MGSITRRRTTAGTLAGALALAVLSLAPGVAAGQSAGDFADWTSVGGSPATATGALNGSSVTLEGTAIIPAGSTTDGSSAIFNRPELTPPLPASDIVNFNGASGNSYTLTFGGQVTDPVLHLASLGSTLHFPAGTQLAYVSGDAQFGVTGSDVVGQIEVPTDDATGTVRIIGTRSSIGFTTSSTAASDGVYLQVGVAPPAAPPPPPPPTPPPPTPAPAQPQLPETRRSCPDPTSALPPRPESPPNIVEWCTYKAVMGAASNRSRMLDSVLATRALLLKLAYVTDKLRPVAGQARTAAIAIVGRLDASARMLADLQPRLASIGKLLWHSSGRSLSNVIGSIAAKLKVHGFR